MASLYLSTCFDIIISNTISEIRERTNQSPSMADRSEMLEELSALDNLRWKSFSPIKSISLVYFQRPPGIATDQIVQEISKKLIIFSKFIAKGSIELVGSFEENTRKNSIAVVTKKIFRSESWCLFRNESQLVELDQKGKEIVSWHYKNVKITKSSGKIFFSLFNDEQEVVPKIKPGPQKNSIRNKSDVPLMKSVQKIKLKNPEYSMALCVKAMRQNKSHALIVGTTSDESLSKRFRRNWQLVFKKPWTE